MNTSSEQVVSAFMHWSTVICRVVCSARKWTHGDSVLTMWVQFTGHTLSEKVERLNSLSIARELVVPNVPFSRAVSQTLGSYPPNLQRLPERSTEMDVWQRHQGYLRSLIE